MVNYYDILKVSPKASSVEIKSAYRRLARKLHPDKNNGSEETALKFAAIAEAYEVLGNSRERNKYDRRLADFKFNADGNGNGDTVFASTNRHAARWRQMVYEKRYNDIIDRIIAEERREALALQRFIFPLVALFLSTLFFAMVRPAMFLSNLGLASDLWIDMLGILVRIVVVVLAIVGIIHLIGRFREAFDRFAYDDNDLHDSVLDDTEIPPRSYSRYSMSALIVGGIVLSVGVGYAIGLRLDDWFIPRDYLFQAVPLPDLLLYPPIFVLLVDGVHRLILAAEA